MNAPADGARAVLLDRDGTIIVERDYLGDPAGVELEAGAVRGLQAMTAMGLPLIVLTNQSGVARGYFTRADAERVNARVAALLAAAGIVIAGWYICPHAPADGCDCRKPLPGMAVRAATDHKLDLTRCFMIGDKSSDIGVAHAIGATGILVSTGHAGADAARERARGTIICADLADAAEVIASRLGIRQPSDREAVLE